MLQQSDQGLKSNQYPNFLEEIFHMNQGSQMSLGSIQAEDSLEEDILLSGLYLIQPLLLQICNFKGQILHFTVFPFLT